MPSSITKGEEWTYGDLFQWLTKRGIEEQLPLEPHGATFRISEISTSGLRNFQNSFAKEELQLSYWSEENMVESYALEHFEDTLALLLRPYFIKDKSIDFQADYAASRQVNTLDSLEQAYDAEQTQLQEKQAALPTRAADTVWKLLVEAGHEEAIFDELPPMADLDAATLAVLLGPDSNQQEVQDILDSPHDHDRAALLNKALLTRVIQDSFQSYAPNTQQDFDDCLANAQERWRRDLAERSVDHLPDPQRTMVRGALPSCSQQLTDRIGRSRYQQPYTERSESS